MSIIGSNVLAGASGGAGDTGYQIQRSVRLNSADSAYFSRTPSSAGNRKTWTWSGWVKRSKLGVQQSIFGAGTSGQDFRFRFESSDTLRVVSGNIGTDLDAITSSVFRDPSAWFHIILQIDTTQVTGSNRAKIYVNGVQQTISFTNTPSQNQDLSVNSAIEHRISNADGYGYVDLYLADVHLIDGQALDPTSFGEFDDNGIWQPKAYTGTYGTNGGFHLDFADNSTAAALGTDTSGAGNDWTVNNISVEAGNGSWIPMLSATGGSNLSSSDKAFDGDILTAAANYTAGNGNPEGLKVTFSSAITAATSFKVYAQVASSNPGESVEFYKNGSLAVTLPNDSQGNTITAMVYDMGAGSYSSIEVREAAAYGFNGIALYGIEVDGVFLIDYSQNKNNDSLIDVPTNGTETDTGLGGEVRGNYATLNPLDSSSNYTLSNGNLNYTHSTSGHQMTSSTIAVNSGKWYVEVTPTALGDTYMQIGITPANTSNTTYTGNNGYAYIHNGNKQGLASSSSYGNSFAANDVIGIAFDADGGNLYFYKNGVAQNSGTAAFTGIDTSKNWRFSVSHFNSGTGFANFGQRPFAYTAPSGYKALCTQNLPEPTIPDGSTAMDVITWNGDTTSVANAGDRSFSSLNMSPDLVWIKQRNQAFSTGHQLYDAVRAAGSEKELNTSSTAAEGAGNIELYGWLNSFDSNGFTVRGGSTGNTYVNATGVSYVAWAWDAGANSSKTYAVTVVSDGGNKYRFDGHGTSAVTLDLEEGSTYTFDQSDSSNAGHPLRFSTTSDGTHGGGSEYTTGVTTVGTPGSAGASTTIVVASGAPTLYYYCSVHSGMGGQANTNSTAGASNFDGSIQSTVRANPSAGFSIVTFTASSSQPDTVGHGLNAKPNLIILKDRDASPRDWWTWHIGIDEDDALKLNATSGITNLSDSWSPNSSTFQVQSVASSGNDHVAYCFAPVDGYSSGFSYTGNGSTDGSFVYLGLRPRLILLKCSSTTGNWTLLDTAREGYNVDNDPLYPNLTNAEGATDLLDITSNGFKLRTTDASVNSSGATYIGYAWAENPFKTARAR